mgnify:CR=1 FL=1
MGFSVAPVFDDIICLFIRVIDAGQVCENKSILLISLSNSFSSFFLSLRKSKEQLLTFGSIMKKSHIFCV